MCVIDDLFTFWSIIELPNQLTTIHSCSAEIDALSADTRAALRRTDARTQGVQAVSALSGEGLDDLIAAIEESEPLA